MITLTSGGIQNPSGIFVPNGSIEFQLNVDATIIVSPCGLMMASVPTSFQFGSTGNLVDTCQIWSNAELNPQNLSGLGTFFKVTIYDSTERQLVPLD